MKEKTARVQWKGAGKAGQGLITTETAALQNYPYGFSSRFDDDRAGTNPEELLGAAHAACFTMAFSFAADKAGYATREVLTNAKVYLVREGEGFAIERIDLHLEASIDGIDDETFQQLAQGAKRDCPLSKALQSVPQITLHASLRP